MTAATKQKFPGDEFWTITSAGIVWHARCYPPVWEAIEVTNSPDDKPRKVTRPTLKTLIKEIGELPRG